MSCIQSSNLPNSRSSVPYPVDHLVDYDLAERECQITLLTMSVEGSIVPRMAASIDHAIQLGLNQNSSVPYHHWALEAFFKDSITTHVFEAGADGKGNIAAYRSLGLKADKEFDMGKVNTSPNKLLKLAQNHDLNGKKYSPLENNCQLWVKMFAKKISEDLYKAMDSCDTLAESDAVPRLAAAAGIFGTGILFASSMVVKSLVEKKT